MSNAHLLFMIIIFAFIGIVTLAVFVTVLATIIKASKNNSATYDHLLNPTNSDASARMHESFMRDHTIAHNNAMHAHNTAMNMHNSAVNMHTNHMMHM